jgi:hypothetical protein
MIIGLAGAKESGKNTAAQFIAEQFAENYEVIEHSFAAKLKQSAMAALTGQVLSVEDAVIACDELKTDSEFAGKVFDPDEGEDWVIAEYQFTGREFLQWYGTEAHREIFGQDFWVGQVMDNIPNPVTETGTLEEWNNRIDLITDVRFPNEAEAVGSGGKVFRINRKAVESNDGHASEKPLPDELVWAEIDNNGSLEDLRETLRPHVNYALDQMGV